MESGGPGPQGPSDPWDQFIHSLTTPEEIQRLTENLERARRGTIARELSVSANTGAPTPPNHTVVDTPNQRINAIDDYVRFIQNFRYSHSPGGSVEQRRSYVSVPDRDRGDSYVPVEPRPIEAPMIREYVGTNNPGQIVFHRPQVGEQIPHVPVEPRPSVTWEYIIPPYSGEWLTSRDWATEYGTATEIFGSITNPAPNPGNWKQEEQMEQQTMAIANPPPEWMVSHLTMLCRTMDRPMPELGQFLECKDKREINKKFMEARTDVPKVDMAGAQRTALTTFFKASVNLPALKDQMDRSDVELRRVYSNFEDKLKSLTELKQRVQYWENMDMNPLLQEVEDVLQTGKWELVEVSSTDQFIMFAQKHDTLVHWIDRAKNMDVKKNFGRMKVRINFRESRIRVQPYRDNIFSNNYYHPHVGSDGEVCWGNAAGMISNSLTNRKVKDVLGTIDLLLHEYNDESPYRNIITFGMTAAGYRIMGKAWAYSESIGNTGRRETEQINEARINTDEDGEGGDHIVQVTLMSNASEDDSRESESLALLGINGQPIVLRDWNVFVSGSTLSDNDLYHDDEAYEILDGLGLI